jgi:hypothetical protein
MTKSHKRDVAKAFKGQQQSGPKEAIHKQESQSSINEKVEFFFGDIDRDKPSVAEWFDEWDKCGHTQKLIACLKEISSMTMLEAKTQKRIVVYGEWPLSSKTKLRPKKHFNPDWQWARLRVMQEPRIIGHVIANRFYIVFPDIKHQFCPSE